MMATTGRTAAVTPNKAQTNTETQGSTKTTAPRATVRAAVKKMFEVKDLDKKQLHRLPLDAVKAQEKSHTSRRQMEDTSRDISKEDVQQRGRGGCQGTTRRRDGREEGGQRFNNSIKNT